MNIAIVFYGQLRWFDSFNQTFNLNFLPFLKQHNVRYFGSFWENSCEKLNDLSQLYQPNIFEKCRLISCDEVKLYFNNTINKISDNLPNQMYSLNKSLELLEKYQLDNNIQFDLFIKIRTDLVFLNSININICDENSVYVCPDRINPINHYTTDLLLMTKKYEHFKYVCRMGFYFDEILLNLSNKINRNIIYHEEVLAEHLNKGNISVKSHNFVVDLARKYV